LLFSFALEVPARCRTCGHDRPVIAGEQVELPAAAAMDRSASAALSGPIRKRQAHVSPFFSMSSPSNPQFVGRHQWEKLSGGMDGDGVAPGLRHVPLPCGLGREGAR
jgi:hypothetical protein